MKATTARVLMVAGAVPAEPEAFLAKLEQFRQLGADVSLACNFDPSLLSVADGVATCFALRSSREDDPSRLRRALEAATAPRSVWLRVRRHRPVRQRARRAHVLVALDLLAIHAVWELAQRHRRPQAVFGIEPSLRVVRRHREKALEPARGLLRSVPAWGGVAYRSLRQAAYVLVVTAVRAAVSPVIMRSRAGTGFWRTMVALPGLPDPVRRRLALTVHENLLRVERFDAAFTAWAQASQRLRERQVRADLALRAAYAEAAYGTPRSLDAAMTTSLTLADEHLDRKEFRKAAGLANRALGLLMHRCLHLDRLTSPLAEDPGGYLARWHRSAMGRVLAAPRGRSVPAHAAPGGRAARLLVAVDSDQRSSGEILRRFESMTGVEVRILDFSEREELMQLVEGSRQLIEHVIAGRSVYGNRVEELLRPHLDWADTLFIDGCDAIGAICTVIDPGRTRVVVRLHGVEVFTFWPQLVDFSRVDELIVTSEHLKSFCQEVLPALAHGPLPQVIVDARGLRELHRPKIETARFTLAVMGVDAVSKDPRWAIDVLRLLRERDSRYRLLIFGAGLKPDESADIAAYDQRLAHDVRRMGGSVAGRGNPRDVGEALTEVGVIVSSSVRESFDGALIAGAASGAVPVVRNWPFFADRQRGARASVPPEWVVDTPEQAAERIRTLTSSVEIWRDAGRAAAEAAFNTWDGTAAGDDLEHILIGAPR